MSTAFQDLRNDIAAMTTEQIRAEIAQRGYRLEIWLGESRNPWNALVVDDSVDEPGDHWAGIVASAFCEPTERAALEMVCEDMEISGWTVTFAEQPS